MAGTNRKVLIFLEPFVGLIEVVEGMFGVELPTPVEL